ncbi:MAG: hypothetical protein ACKOEB_03800 [Actinomycetota bacterium]
MSRSIKQTARTPLFILSATALILSLVPLSAFSAQKISAGAPCTKLNSKATANNKTFTCIKKGAKLVWNNGVVNKVAAPSVTPTPSASPTPTPSLTPTKNEDISRDSRISNLSLLTNVSVCKTEDKTPDFTPDGAIARNGFPRPKSAIYSSGKARVLVVPFSYKTWPFRTVIPSGANQTLTDLDLLKMMSRDLEKFYRDLSGGRFEVNITVLPEQDWWTLDPNSNFSSDAYANNFGPFLNMIQQNDGKIDFTAYDSYIFIAPLTAPLLPVAQAAYTTEIKTSKGQANKLVAITAGWQNYPLVFHELGHSLFGFEDLYLQSEIPTEWLPQELNVPLTWEIMANSNLAAITNWNRLLMGWIPDEEVRCLSDQSSSIHYLSGVPSQNQPKIVLINLAPGVTLAAEAREGVSSQGLLLYIIDTNLAHGQVPMRALPYLLKAGESKELFDWKFKVLETNKDGLLVEVSKGSGKKYVAPISSQVNQGGGDKPRPRMGEIVPTGYLQARATWEISNYKSYRIFITPFDDPKRILFDTGIVNDSRDPLVVEVSGLICGKEFTTTSQFWTERDGKGVMDQSSSGQLRKFECKS